MDDMMCSDPFHEDGCPGSAGGDHELRTPVEVWCAHDENPAVFAVRFPYGIESLCAGCGLTLARDATAFTDRRNEALRNEHPQECPARHREYSLTDCTHEPGCPTLEDTILCPLRGKAVPISECVASCPAPEQREVCAMEFEPDGGITMRGHNPGACWCGETHDDEPSDGTLIRDLAPGELTEMFGK